MPIPLGLPPRAVLDGGMGTALIARGLDLRHAAPEAWNLERPDAVRDVHRRFVAAGAQAIHTNSFGGNRLRLRASGREIDLDAINRAAVDLACLEAAGATVVGSMGPSGRLPPPEGDADLHELEDAFAEQASILAAAGCGFLHLETFYHPKELRAALRGARAGAPGVAVVASFTCVQQAGSGPIEPALRTPAGFSGEAMIHVLVEERPDGAGVNCSLSPAAMRPLIAALAARVAVPILAQPTAAPDRHAPLLPAEFAAGALELFAAGAAGVGGCCGTGPGDLAALRAALA